MRALTLCVGLSLTAVGLLGALASEFKTQPHAVALAEALRSPPGSRVLVRAFLERVREVGGGAAVSSVTDCAGGRAAVFFPAGAPPGLSFRLVALDAAVQDYKGARELAVESPSHATPFDAGALALTPDDLVAGWRALLCTEVAVAGQVAWAQPYSSDPRSAEVGVRTNGSDLRVLVHAEAFLDLSVEAGARATFVGVVAASDDGLSPVLHVRV